MKKDFLWGSASAAYQIEGEAYTSGKGHSIWDEYAQIEGNTFKNTTGEVAIDFYNRYKEDIALMKEQGLKAYRFSVSWPRIFPEGRGEVNQAGVDFYHNVIDELLANQIEPILTIYHWDLPLALQQEYGGFESRQIIEDFANYSRKLFEEYGGKVKYWVSQNEQNIFTALGYVQKIHPPEVSDFQRFLNANHYASLANARAIAIFKEMGIEGQIGASFAYSPSYAKSSNPLDVMAMEDAQELTDWFWMDVYAHGKYPKIALKLLQNQGLEIPFEDGDEEILKAGKPHFMGINYYQSFVYKAPNTTGEKITASSNTVSKQIAKQPVDEYFVQSTNEHLAVTDWNWTIDPSGLTIALRRITSRYDLPILISENGLGAFDRLEADGSVHDDYRIEYLKEHIKAINEAQKVGCDVIGYCTWSFQDLFSWLNGYQKRYGFVYVDRDEESAKELKRYKKDSFYWYADVIANNGLLEK